MVEALKCPSCSHKLDATTCLSGEPDTSPGDGDISSCLYCGVPIVFCDDGVTKSLRTMSPEEIQALPADVRVMLSGSITIGVLSRAMKGNP